MGEPAEQHHDEEAIDHPIGVGMGGACPECSAPVDLAQEFCLECGAPVRVRKRTQRAVPRRPSSFPWVPFFVVLGLVAFGVTTALLADEKRPARDRTSTDSSADTGTIPSVTTTPTEATDTTTIPTTPTDPTTTPTTPTTSATTTTPTTSATTPTTSTTPTTATTGTGGGTATWPAGTSGYTVVIQSLNKSLYTQSDAQARANEAAGKGLEAGVIDSNDYSSLASDLWVVFSGVYTGEDQANAHLPTVTSAGYPSAYVRQIAP